MVSTPPQPCLFSHHKMYLLNLVPKVTRASSPALRDCLLFSPPSCRPHSVAHCSPPSLLSHSSLTKCCALGQAFREVLPWSLPLKGLWLTGAFQVACPKMNGHRGSVSSKKVGPSLPRAFREDWSWALESE